MVSAELGVVLDKAEVRKVLQGLMSGRQFSPGDLGIEQATNAIGSLQRPPRDVQEAALTVGCNYCGRTPGNRCRRGDLEVPAHPSRIARAFSEDR